MMVTGKPSQRDGAGMIIASWNVNSIRARVEQVQSWLKLRNPDVLLLQELKGAEFPALFFKELGYESAAVTQKTYNGVAILSRHPLEVISTTLLGDEADSHARFLEVIVQGIRIVNIYLPNGNPVGSEKFNYKLTWMARLDKQMRLWLQSKVPTVVAGDFNVIPEDIDCHKPSSWMHDALFQPEPRARYRALLGLGYTDAFRSLHPGAVSSLFGITSAKRSSTTGESASTTSCCPRSLRPASSIARSTRRRAPRRNPQITRRLCSSCDESPMLICAQLGQQRSSA
jgi:exodeoxyribonuclease-3